MTDRNLVILFDLDGTLIDSTPAILESFSAAYDAHGLSAPAEERIVPMIGVPLSAMFERLGVPVTEVESFVAAYKRHYRVVSREMTVLLPGAEEAVREAARFARLGIVTTKTGKYSVELMEHLGLMPFFEVLVGSEHVIRHKPHPEPILKAIDAMAADPARTWMVGDTPMDLEASAAAGVQAVGVTCGYADETVLSPYGVPLAPDARTAVERIACKTCRTSSTERI